MKQRKRKKTQQENLQFLPIVVYACILYMFCNVINIIVFVRVSERSIVANPTTNAHVLYIYAGIYIHIYQYDMEYTHSQVTSVR